MKMSSYQNALCAIFLCLCSSSAFSQTAQKENQNLADSLRKVGIKFTRAFNHDSAVHYYNLAAQAYSSDNDRTGHQLMQVKIADENGIHSKYDQAYQILAETIKEAHTREDLRVLFEAYRIKGITQNDQRNSKGALASYDSALKYMPDAGTKEGETRRGKILRNMAVANAYTGNYLKAEEFFQESRQIFDSIEVSKPTRGLAYDNLGNLSNMMGQPGKAIGYYSTAMEIYESMEENPDVYSIAFLYFNIGNAYEFLEQPQSAIDYYEESIRLMKEVNPDSRFLPNVYYNLGAAYTKVGHPDKTISASKTGLELSRKVIGDQKYETGLGYLHVGNYYGMIGNHELAIQNHESAIEIFSISTNQRSPFNLPEALFALGDDLFESGQREAGFKKMSDAIATMRNIPDGIGHQAIQSCNFLAQRYLEANKPDSALKYYQLSLMVNSLTYEDSDYLTNSKIDEVLNTYQQFVSIMGKARSYEKMYKSTGKQESLVSAYKMLQDAEFLVNKLREQPVLFTDQLSTSTLISGSFSSGINICYELYKLTGEKRYAEMAYGLFEKNKASQTLSGFSLGNSELLNVPDSILVEEKEFSSSITYLETQIFELRTAEDADEKQETLTLYESELVEVRNKRERLIERLRQEYPSYFQLKYDHEHLTIDQSRDQFVTNNDVLLNYHLLDSAVYIFKITRDNFDFSKNPLRPGFGNVLQSLISDLKSPRSAHIEKYLEKSATLMEALFPEDLVWESVENLVIIPDQLLHLVPFDILVEPTNSKVNSFKDLPYLIKKHTIRYGLSATLLAKQHGDNKRKRKSNVLAFAPVFSQETSQVPDMQDTTRSSLGYLPFTTQEIQNISNYFPTEQLLGKEATEKKFRQLSTEYDIIHLASHGLLNEANPLFSRLVFSPYDTDSINDGFLNTTEILNMQIPAEMVVLSACNTGSGSIIAGEGAISLANGFFYAGSKSLVMSLWTANDQSTASLMNDFYANLSEGQPKGQALRSAKLSFLENADDIRSHPYYWAHMVVNGNDSPITRDRKLWIYWVGALALIVLMAARRKKAKAAA